jgi:hypothetical protein
MNYSGLIKSITGATARLQENVAAVANQALVIRNWLVGAWAGGIRAKRKRPRQIRPKVAGIGRCGSGEKGNQRPH